MALHFYMNGTAGAKDGVEVSNGDLSNPIVTDGVYVAEGTTVTKRIPLSIRADEGETWRRVELLVMSSENSIGDDTYSFGGVTAIFRVVDFTGSWEYLYGKSTVTDVNTNFVLYVKINGSDINNNVTNAKLVAIGVHKVV